MITGSKEYLAMMKAPALAPVAPVRTGYEDKIGHVVTNATEQIEDDYSDLPF
jgi:hypothetical protein